jgi:hypothetical protein
MPGLTFDRVRGFRSKRLFILEQLFASDAESAQEVALARKLL